MAKRKLNPFRIFRGRKTEPKKLDPTPMELPAGYATPRPLAEVIAGMVRQAVEAEKGEEFETPEEADDFDMDDDDLLDMSPYELNELTEQEPLPKPHVKAETPPVTPPEAPQETITPPEGESPEQVE
ncbi:hypothetical protein [Microviridae sp.]|nr:hypothetical protein [Microviridae sp.]